MTQDQEDKVEAVLAAIQAMEEHLASQTYDKQVDEASIRRQIAIRIDPPEWVPGMPLAGRGFEMAMARMGTTNQSK